MFVHFALLGDHPAANPLGVEDKSNALGGRSVVPADAEGRDRFVLRPIGQHGELQVVLLAKRTLHGPGVAADPGDSGVERLELIELLLETPHLARATARERHRVESQHGDRTEEVILGHFLTLCIAQGECGHPVADLQHG